MTKTIYLIITPGCSACKLQEYIIEECVKNTNIDFAILNFNDPNVPKDVILEDFPVTAFVKDNKTIKSFSGTKPAKDVLQIIKDIDFD